MKPRISPNIRSPYTLVNPLVLTALGAALHLLSAVLLQWSLWAAGLVVLFVGVPLFVARVLLRSSHYSYVALLLFATAAQAGYVGLITFGPSLAVTSLYQQAAALWGLVLFVAVAVARSHFGPVAARRLLVALVAVLVQQGAQLLPISDALEQIARWWLALAVALVALLALALAALGLVRFVYDEWRVASLATLGEGQLAALAARAERVNFRANAVLFRQDAPADRLYLILRGEVELLRRDADGIYAPLALVGAGAWLGEAGLLGRTTRSLAAKASTDVEAIALDREVLATVLAGVGDCGDPFDCWLRRRLSPLGGVEVVSLLSTALADDMPERLRLLRDGLRRLDDTTALWLLGSPLAQRPYRTSATPV